MKKLIPLVALLALLAAPTRAFAQAQPRTLEEEIAHLESGRAHAPDAVARILPQVANRPASEPLRARVEAWARDHARSPQGSSHSSRMSDALGAWRALIGLSVLHDGMTRQEASAVLGSGGVERDQRITWSPFSPRLHVRTFVRASIAADGSLHSFIATRG